MICCPMFWMVALISVNQQHISSLLFFFSSFIVRKLFLWNPSDDVMHEMQNFNDTIDGDTCITVRDYGSNTLLRVQLIREYNEANVIMMTSGEGVLFGPHKHTDALCNHPQSLLMTHYANLSTTPTPISTQTPTSTLTPDEKCEPFCQVPTSCDYRGNKEPAAGYTAHHFSCKCPRNLCNELLVWFQEGSFHGKNDICLIFVDYD